MRLTACLLPAAIATALLLSAKAAPALAADKGVRERIEYHRAQREWLPALSLIESQWRQTPGDDLYRLRVLTLADVGAAERAWQLGQQRRDLFTQDELDRLAADRIARHATWGDVAPVDEREPYADMLRALDVFQQSHANAMPGDLPLRQRLDRLVILNGLDRHAEVSDDYHALRSAGLALPAYVLRPVGESLLSNREPDAAVEVLRAAHAADRDDVDTLVLLAYALLESGRADAARALLADEALRQPPFKRTAGASQSWENWGRYSLDTNLAMVHAYSRDPSGAQRMLAPKVALAPASSDLQAKSGIVALQRNRPGEGLERLDVALAIDPRNLEARIARVDALTRLDRHAQARQGRDTLVTTYPGDARVQRMDRDWQRSSGWGGELAAERGRSDPREGVAGASPLGSRDGGHRALAWSPRLAERWRIGATTRERWAEFDGPRVHSRRSGAMLAHAHDRLRAELGIDRAHGDAQGSTATTVSAAWRINDAWRLRGRAAHNAADASLQALQAGIDADHWQVGADWAPDERLWVGGDVGQWRFSDGNRREVLSAYGGYGFHVRPRHAWSWDASLGTSRSSRDDAPYFNPSRDASWSTGLNLESIGYQRYERSFVQRAGITLGQYWQEDFGTAATVSARYRHEWTFAGGQRLEYGVSWSRPVYDGNRETRIGFDARLSWGSL